jgi:hypothetical protein
MELYTLDNLLRRQYVIDQYESFIWTERITAYGDFELVLPATIENRNLLPIGTRLVHNESYIVMTVETVETKSDSEGQTLLTITGRSLEAILEDRVARNTMADLTLVPSWVLWGTPGYIARTIFEDICLYGDLSVGDKIPYLEAGTLLPPGSIEETDELVVVELEVTTVYEAVKKLCEQYNLGFRLVRWLDNSKLFFEVYTGSDRTSAQIEHPAVIFSPDLDNITDISELTSVSTYKNVAYVFSKNGSLMVYSDTANPSTIGFERRVLLVKADDIDEEVSGEELTAILNQKGQEALAEHRALSAFDGEITHYSTYVYRVDYNLGDIVEMRTGDGVTNNMRVTEQIFVSDGEGDRAYPTLAVDLFITPGSWNSWGNETWDDGDPDETWDEE